MDRAPWPLRWKQSQVLDPGSPWFYNKEPVQIRPGVKPLVEHPFPSRLRGGSEVIRVPASLLVSLGTGPAASVTGEGGSEAEARSGLVVWPWAQRHVPGSASHVVADH